jgi:DNA-directed RNA polymerase specialized sigma24 family protein
MMEGISESQQLADLYRRYSPSLYRRACWLTGEPEESLDIIQATFLSFMLMTMRQPLRGTALPYTVLYTITTHKAVDRLRRRARWTGRLNLNDDEGFEGSERVTAQLRWGKSARKRTDWMMGRVSGSWGVPSPSRFGSEPDG